MTKEKIPNKGLRDFEAKKMRLEGLGLKVNASEHEGPFVFARIYFSDPERCPAAKGSVEGRNLLEFVCYDASVG